MTAATAINTKIYTSHQSITRLVEFTDFRDAIQTYFEPRFQAGASPRGIAGHVSGADQPVAAHPALYFSGIAGVAARRRRLAGGGRLSRNDRAVAGAVGGKPATGRTAGKTGLARHAGRRRRARNPQSAHRHQGLALSAAETSDAGHAGICRRRTSSATKSAGSSASSGIFCSSRGRPSRISPSVPAEQPLREAQTLLEPEA